MATMASSNNSSPIFTPATTPEGSVSEPSKFIESMPSVNAGTPLIREWLSKWIVEHDLGSTVSGFQVAGINQVYWNGVDIRALDSRTMYRELDSWLGSWGPYWKMKEIYVTAIKRDIKRARDFEQRQVWIARWKICSAVFKRYWNTLTDNPLDAIGLSCLLTCIITSYLGIVGVDPGYMAGFFVAWVGLILWLTVETAGTSSTSASPRNKSDQKNQNSELLLGVALGCFVASGIESCLGMITGSATHISICWFSWLGLLISLSLDCLLFAVCAQERFTFV